MKDLEFLNYELIKAHILDPDNSPLSEKHQDMLNRIVSAAKVLDNNPNRKHAVALHLAKYPHIKRSQAYMDMKIAAKMFSSFHTFPFDYWQTWLINDIVRNIKRCEDRDSLKDRLTIAKEHANLANAIGKKPEGLDDMHRHENREFYIVVQLDNNVYKTTVDEMHKLPTLTMRAINKVLTAGFPIDEEEAKRIIES